MLAVDIRRLFASRLFYIMLGIALLVPVLILVMTTMMDGTVSTNPQTGQETVMEGFKNVWQILGAPSNTGTAGMDMSLTAMCNVNMMYFAVAVFVCLFVAEDFRSGYAKNLFTVRAKKTDYVLSKTIVGFVASACIFALFFVGAMIGGKVAGLPFTMEGFDAGNVVWCMLAKIALSAAFVAVPVLAGVIAKQKAWLSVLLAMGIGMLFFTMIPMATPLDATFLHLLLCLVGGGGLALGLGAIGNAVLKKTTLI
ncbi:MAG: ABC transporter permease [Clostridia bacterium]|nr:ABC transporter permease [Clostridia bacterium]